MTTLIASEVERVRAPERASEEAATSFQRAVLEHRIPDRDDLVARERSSGRTSSAGGSRGRRARASTQPDRGRLAPSAAGRRRPGARSIAPGSIAAPSRQRRRRGHGARSRPRRRHRPPSRLRHPARARVRPIGLRVRDRPQPAAEDPLDLHRAGNEALLAANVVEGDPERSSSHTRRQAPTNCCCRT